MHRSHFLTLLLTASLAVTWSRAQAAVTITSDGQPRATIIIPASADATAREAADILQYFVRRISGAELEIITENALKGVGVAAGRLIVAGNTKVAVEDDVAEAHLLGDEHVPGEAPQAAPAVQNYLLIGTDALAQRLGIEKSELGPGGIQLTSFANGMALLGGPERVAGKPGRDDGALRYAVIELLERLGVRYLWPGSDGVVLPQEPTITLAALNHSYTPQVRMRYIRWGGYGERLEIGAERLGLTSVDWSNGLQRALAGSPPYEWLALNRMGGDLPRFVHGGGGLRNGADYLETNPEWFAMQADGTRSQDGDPRWRLCKSNLQLIEHVANDIIAQINDDPTIELISICPNDGGSRTGWCLCPACEALDPPTAPKINLVTYPTSDRKNRVPIEHASLTDRVVWYWNAIAERVVKVHPEIRLGVSAYSAFSLPPVKEKLHPNFVLRYVPESPERVGEWQAMGMSQVFWRPNILLANRRDGKLRSIVGKLASYMQAYAAAGMNQSDFDSIGHNWATLGLSYYAAARLLWNPNLEANAIISDYASGFGKGAPWIEKYFQRIEELTPNVTATFNTESDYTYRPEVVTGLRNLLNEAAQAADDPVIARRIAFLRYGLNYTELHERLDYLSWSAREKQEIDRDYATRLVDLNCLLLRDLVANHHTTCNAYGIVWGSGTFARHTAIKGRRVTPSDPAMLERLKSGESTLTGNEQSLDEMLAAFGL